MMRRILCLLGIHAWRGLLSARQCRYCGKYQSLELTDMGRSKVWATIEKGDECPDCNGQGAVQIKYATDTMECVTCQGGGTLVPARSIERCAQCEYCGQDDRHIEATFPTCEHPLWASLPLRYRELEVDERTDPPPAWCPLRCQHRRVTRDDETAYCDDCGKRCDYNAETRNWE